MPELFIIAEGVAEETFVKEILAPRLRPRSVYAKALPIRGIKSWNACASASIVRMLKDKSSIITTFVDYYGLKPDWPGKQEALAKPTAILKAKAIEDALLAYVESKFPGQSIAKRFIPYISMHEFEALLFSDPKAFAEGTKFPQAAEPMSQQRGKLSPEEINNSPETSPSKRLEGIFKEYVGQHYTKPRFGIDGAKAIGLDRIRRECAHFNEWMTKLEGLQ